MSTQKSLLTDLALTGLDMQYRYWSYIEAHPAHVSLTAESRADALEVLRWSYTGKVP